MANKYISDDISKNIWHIISMCLINVFINYSPTIYTVLHLPPVSGWFHGQVTSIKCHRICLCYTTNVDAVFPVQGLFISM